MTARARARWYDELEPASAAVECTGARHLVAWRRGRLVLLDHDLAAERAALALGGAPPPCVELLLAWRDGEAWAGAARPLPLGFVRRARRPALPDDLVPRRELGVVRAWERAAWQHPTGEEANDLFRYLRRRALAGVLAAATDAQRRYGGGRVAFADVRLRRGGAPPPVGPAEPELAGRLDPRQTSLVVWLGAGWLRSVWARGIASVGGAFVLRVVDGSAWPVQAAVEVVDWLPAGDGDGAREPVAVPATVALGDGGYYRS